MSRYSTPGRHVSPGPRSRSGSIGYGVEDHYAPMPNQAPGQFVGPPPQSPHHGGYAGHPTTQFSAPYAQANHSMPTVGVVPGVPMGGPMYSVPYQPPQQAPPLQVQGSMPIAGYSMPAGYQAPAAPLSMSNGYAPSSASVARSISSMAPSAVSSRHSSVSRLDFHQAQVMPHVLVAAGNLDPGAVHSMTILGGQPANTQPLGELFVDRTSPDSLAPWLLMLEKRAPFVVHEIDPRQKDNFAIPTNPTGVLPMWVDADTSCVWGASTVMRFVCEKHQLSPGSYAVEDFHRKTKTNMAIDWCANVLKPHINQVVWPEMYDQSGRASVGNAKRILQRDMQVLSDFWLRDSPYIGGTAPDISDCYICMQLLLLYSTDFPPQNEVRKYLHATADQCDNWNEVTSGLREYCAVRQGELAQWAIETEQKAQATQRALAAPSLAERGAHDEQTRRQIEAECLKELEEWKNQMEAEFRRRDAEDARKREAENQRWHEESIRKRAEMDERIRREEEQWRTKFIDLVSSQRVEEENRWNHELAMKKAEMEEIERRAQEEERRMRAQLEEEMAQRRAWEEQETANMMAQRPQSVQSARSEHTSTRTTTPRDPNAKPHVGVEIKMLDDAAGNRDCVVVVHSVVPNTPAYKAGLKMDDIIQSWDGVQLSSKAGWVNHVKSSSIGSTVTLCVLRDGQMIDIPLTIGSSSREMGGVRKVSSRTSTTTTGTRGVRSKSITRR